jgi:hypothetical protein
MPSAWSTSIQLANVEGPDTSGKTPVAAQSEARAARVARQ